MLINLDPVSAEVEKIDTADAMFSLCVNAKWLVAERYRAGLKTLVADCQSQSQVDTLQHVLSKIRYCTSNDLILGAEDASLAILKSWALTPQDTLLVGIGEANKMCGSHAYVRDIQLKLPSTWANAIYPNFDTAFRHRNGKSSLVVVDDFVGTGDKILKKLMRLKENPKTDDYQIHVVAFAGMDEGLTKIADFVDNRIHAHIVLDKCLSSEKPKSVADALKESMLNLESRFFTNVNKYSLGYGQSEAAFYLESFNIPNNTFPVLWWEEYADQTERPTIFRRR